MVSPTISRKFVKPKLLLPIQRTSNRHRRSFYPKPIHRLDHRLLPGQATPPCKTLKGRSRESKLEVDKILIGVCIGCTEVDVCDILANGRRDTGPVEKWI